MAHQIPLTLQPKANKVLAKALEDDIIMPEPEPTKWTSLAFFVLKPGGTGLHLVMDFSHLNKYVQWRRRMSQGKRSSDVSDL